MYPCHVDSGTTPKNLVLVHPLSYRNIKGAFLDFLSTELTRRSRIEVLRVDDEKLSVDRVGGSSKCIRARVQAARDIQQKRFSNIESTDIICNADVRVGEIWQDCKLPQETQSLMRAAMTQLNLLAWDYHHILKLARTTANLAGREEISSVHLAEALHHRPKLMTG